MASLEERRSNGSHHTKITSETIIARIEGLIQAIVDEIIEDKEDLLVRLSRRGLERGQAQDAAISSATGTSDVQSREIRFPGATPREAWAFSVVIRILEMMHKALVQGLITTKRDIFYKDPNLFGKQSVVDQYVDDIACTLGVQRQQLNVVATAKGLAVGPLLIRRMNGSLLDCSLDDEGTLIPNPREIQSLDVDRIHWVLMIEKEATFRSLAATRFWKSPIIGDGLLVTAKGYPDIATRSLLHSLSTHASTDESRCPIYALVDFDPDGIGILSTYKHGSVALAHENDHLRALSIRWIGVRSSIILHASAASDGRSTLQMSRRDRRKARGLLNKHGLQNDGETEWRRELQVMLMLNIKVEIQALSELDGGLEGWLEDEIIGPSPASN